MSGSGCAQDLLPRQRRGGVWYGPRLLDSLMPLTHAGLAAREPPKLGAPLIWKWLGIHATVSSHP
eukprot:3699386-Pyramimonas_sp.AAC.1